MLHSPFCQKPNLNPDDVEYVRGALGVEAGEEMRNLLAEELPIIEPGEDWKGEDIVITEKEREATEREDLRKAKEIFGPEDHELNIGTKVGKRR